MYLISLNSTQNVKTFYKCLIYYMSWQGFNSQNFEKIQIVLKAAITSMQVLEQFEKFLNP